MLALNGRKWILATIAGLDSLPEMEARDPHIIFDAEEQRIHGFAGCNSFFGQYQIKPDSKISFANIASTKMYCANTMELKQLSSKHSVIVRRYPSPVTHFNC